MSLMDVPTDASPTPISMNAPAFGQATNYTVFQVFVLFSKAGQKFVIGKIKIK